MIAQYPYTPPTIPKPTREDYVAARLTWAAHGITEDDFHDANRDPEKDRKFLEWSLQPTPTLHSRAHEAAKKNPLQAAAYLLRHNGRKVTNAALARELGVSVATLYRKYSQFAVRLACEEPPASLPQPSQPRSSVALAQ